MSAPSTTLPAIFLAHGSPGLIWPKEIPRRPPAPGEVGGPLGPHRKFLETYGPHILEKYQPKAIVVFSAHWETKDAIQVMDNEENELLYDYYNFPEQLYNLHFKSKGSSKISSRVVELLTKNGIKAEKLHNGRGLDHGVFVPFLLMFPNDFNIPIIEVSIDASLDPEKHLDIGKALAPLRDENVLIISGGLTIHTFQDGDAWNPLTASPGYLDFENQIKSGVTHAVSAFERNEKLLKVTTHPFYRKAHPRVEHFIPIYIAAGAGSREGDKASVVSDLHGAITIEFGV
ncbi:hypothetical protein BDV3_005919 [Batrachochytrium dendrobatidis]|uniref:Extradiol ring-cleavage dioxygenase class III enzyme subunit B domain-containing protein n=1 Tax=Batrachochytrium dendrobatidis (strain JEL423) TaxID=403673 RepID=A0A177WNT4_BATDL|nr:hypothetical protein QVD99_002280 [Batrachochytrium dendrobatidis]OAJ41021.1 hypothetical protein BDEG_24684 [Batrachochytrium dendrobatidis JEL423]